MRKEYIHDEMETKRKATKTVIKNGGRKNKGDSKDKKETEPIVKDIMKLKDGPIVKDKDKDLMKLKDGPIVKDTDTDKHVMRLIHQPIGTDSTYLSYIRIWKPFIPIHYHPLLDNIPIHFIHDFDYIHFHLFTIWFFSHFNIPIPTHLHTFFSRHFFSFPFYSSLFHILSQTNTGDASHDNSGSIG